MTRIPETGPENTDAAFVKIYDLRDHAVIERASADRNTWGSAVSDVYPMGLHHVVIAFRSRDTCLHLEDSA